MEQTAKVSEDKIPFPQKFFYGCGAFVNNLLADSIGRMLIVLNLGLGMNPALVGLLGALPRLTDAITDPLMGYISDNTRSRWGRRRPYIFCGAILVGIVFALLWQLPDNRSENYYFWYFLIGSLLFYLAYTIFVTPWVALGYELTPDYHERTRLMGVQNFMGQFAYLLTPWLLVLIQNETYFKNMVDGAGGLAIMLAVVIIGLGVVPAVFLRERFVTPSHTADGPEGGATGFTQRILANIREFFSGFLATLKVSAFRKLCTATFLVFNGFIMVAAFQYYVIIYYVFGGDTVAGAEYAGYAGTIAAMTTFAVIPLVTRLSTTYGKKKAFFFSTGVSIVGYLLKWFCYTPELPWLLLVPAPLIAFGFGGLFTLMPSLVADVVDYDELHTRARREGMFGSIFWWVVKLGQALAIAAGGFLLNATGFDVALGGDQSESALAALRLFDAGFPALTSALAIWVISSYGLTEERSYQIRNELESIRGKS